MVAPVVEGIDLFKVAGRSTSGWIPNLKTGVAVRQPFCSQLEERLMLWLEFTKCQWKKPGTERFSLPCSC
jgi:hypothetical protein